MIELALAIICVVLGIVVVFQILKIASLQADVDRIQSELDYANLRISGHMRKIKLLEEFERGCG